MKTLHGLALACLPLSLVLSACGTTEPARDEAPESRATGGPVSITDARGRTIELDHPATKVVSLEWMQTETLVSLGVMPVGHADGDAYNTWVANAQVDDSVKNVGNRSEPSFTEIMKTGPELVIADESGPEAIVKQLEKRDVPVLVLDTADGSRQLDLMKENVQAIAEAVGRTEEADRIIGDLEASMEAGRKAIEESDSEGMKFAMADGWAEGGTVTIRLFGDGSLMSDLAEGLGLENAWTGEVDKDWGLGTTDPEGLTALGDDVNFFYNSPIEADDVFGNQLEKNPIWNNLEFVESDHLHPLEKGVWTFGGPVSAQAFIDQVVADLTE
ncbi:iron-siderophore ABC transporter substrate-binding protein [Nocardioides sp. JQ2195]|uniref:ABC transporter substrate-binding protein n=1 Tax=Nocardioides sp. JQ2195 TaxID=2592334 RepID=UPI00143ED141|nr:iron-siderophore ABC transporter substrate-binding protein [Nocardioides sp. JQ2195]QIX25311.1 iron-siderophore ABC transporter substrate-binding protein [Nocardioides sp. JQ2195]